MNQLDALPPDRSPQLPQNGGQGAVLNHCGGDPQRRGPFGKDPAHETDQGGVIGLIEMLQQQVDVGEGPAGVTAADEMQYVHSSSRVGKR